MNKLKSIEQNNLAYTAFLKSPLLMHFEQILVLFTVPFLTIFIVCKFGSHSLFVLLFAWLTLWPICFPFPHISHTLAISASCTLY